MSQMSEGQRGFMKKTISIILLTLVFITITISCERDDICAEGTPTTPRLIIRFNDISNPDDSKNVRRLTVTGEGLDEATQSLVFNSDTDSINLPLQFQDEDIITTTRYILKKDTDFDSDVDGNGNPILTTESNIDIIEINYTPEFIFVSRACGFKSVFHLNEDGNIAFDIVNDSENWASSFLINNTTIENENEAHITIFH